jgi:tRNA A37 threonylcarbamoyladenosine synthetase subunit TsaC/SUA5/YrdC
VEGSVSSSGFALPVGSLVVFPTSTVLGLVSQGPAEAVSGLLGLFVDQERQLKELVVRGLLYLL